MKGGAYLLLVELEAPLDLGRFRIAPGELVYLGSARRGFGPRLLRHARRLKGPPHPALAAFEARFPGARGRKGALFWHVDHLLEAESARLVGALLFSGESEARLLPRLLGLGARVAAPGFGASDSGAKSHLFYLGHARLSELRGGVWVR